MYIYQKKARRNNIKTELKNGDVIVINKYISPDNITMKQHSFIILNNQFGTVTGVEIGLDLELQFDLVTTVMSSIKNEEHKNKIKSYYPKNMIVEFNDTQISYGNNKAGFIKANQLYYFNKNNIEYFKIGKLNEKTLNKLLELVEINEKNGDLVSNYNNIILNNSTEKETVGN